MRRKRAAAGVLSVLLAILMAFGVQTFAAVLPFETQYDYAAAEVSWLTDLVIKENMDSYPGVGSDVTLIPQAEYPYSQTPESFRAGVDRFCEVYSLSPQSARAASVFMIEFLHENGSSFTSQVTDEAVLDFLSSRGIELPDSPSSEDLVFARALYTAIVTGSSDAFVPENAGASVSLESAMMQYLASLSGISLNELKKWVPDGRAFSVEEYLLAASRLMLWTNGFNVSPDSDVEEVSRLSAVLTLRNLGVNVKENASFSDLQSVYTATLLGKRYGVTPDPAQLRKAVDEGNAAYYVLQLLGKENGLSIREDRYDYEDAFEVLAENTSVFDLEEGEFYADIYRYTAQLRYRSGYIWVYPTAYLTGNEDADLLVAINDTTVKNNYFSRVQLDPDAPEQVVKIAVDATVDGKRSLSTYYITVLEGTEDYVPEKAVDFQNGVGSVAGADSIISQILSKFGVSSSILDTMSSAVYSILPGAVRNVITFIAPTFGETAAPAQTETDGAAPQTPETQSASPDALTSLQNDGYFRSFLDRVGKIVDCVIVGVRGIGLGGKKTTDDIKYNFITLE